MRNLFAADKIRVEIYGPPSKTASKLVAMMPSRSPTHPLRAGVPRPLISPTEHAGRVACGEVFVERVKVHPHAAPATVMQ